MQATSDLGHTYARTTPAGITFMCRTICSGVNPSISAIRESGASEGKPDAEVELKRYGKRGLAPEGLGDRGIRNATPGARVQPSIRAGAT